MEPSKNPHWTENCVGCVDEFKTDPTERWCFTCSRSSIRGKKKTQDEYKKIVKMKTEEEVRKQRDAAYKELERIEKEVPPGSCAWRMQKSYINALDWVLGEE